MTLSERIYRLFRADLHAVLDLVEEPGALLKQAVREMGEEVTRNRKNLASLNEETRQLDVHRKQLEQSLDDLEHQLDICFGSPDQSLARTLVKQKLENRELGKHLSHRQDALEYSRNRLEKCLAEQQLQLQAMQQKAELLVEQPMSAQTDYNRERPVFKVRQEDVEIAYLHEKQLREQS